MKPLIKAYKRFNKQRQLNRFTGKKVALIGYGSHSTQNLYPILAYYNAPVKYIVTASAQSADLINQTNEPIMGTTDLGMVLNDKEIAAVFICVNSDDHFHVAKKALLSEKHVFVEKPCGKKLKELSEISELAIILKRHVVVGLQHRWAPAFQFIKRKNKRPQHYSYSYQTGAFSEGDLFYDLWIHPLDLLVYLFGKATVLSAFRKEYAKGCETVLLTLQHANGCLGQVEISSNYTWQKSAYQLVINQQQQLITCDNYNQVNITRKSVVLNGVPLEKLRRKTSHDSKQINFTNPFIPTLYNNDLYLKGYHQEISGFLKLINGNTQYNCSSAENILDSYRLIEMITRKIK